MSGRIDIRSLLGRIKASARTTRGRNVLTFCAFLALSTLFWFMTVLNDDVRRDYDIPIRITDLPSDVTFLSTVPSSVNVVVNGKGSSLLRYEWSSTPVLRIRYSDFNSSTPNRLSLNEQQLSNIVRGMFSSSTDVVSIRPDSLGLVYTTRPGVRLPVVVNIDAQAAPQYVINGPITTNVDSVTVYTLNGLSSRIVSVKTERLSMRGLSDSTTVEVRIVAPENARVEPAVVTVNIPVEPLISQSRNVRLNVRNVPRGVNLLTFPSTVELNYLLPMSLYHSERQVPTVYVDYNDIVPGMTTLPVRISNISDYYQGMTSSPKSVEFVIERSHANHES